MKKILYIVSTLKRCGPNNQLFNIIYNLDSDVYEPHVLTLSAETSDSFFKKFQDAKIKVHSLSMGRIKGALYGANCIKSYISKLAPNLIHTQGYRADSFVADLPLDIPHIATVRNIPQDDYIMTYGKLLGGYMVHTHVKALRKVDLVVGVSNVVSENLKDYYVLDKVKTINNGVDTNTYFPIYDKNDIDNLRRKLSLPVDKVIYISSGHISTRKDPEFLVNNFLKKSSENECLIFIGSGELLGNLSSKYKKHQKVKFFGRVENVAEYLQASDFFLSSSKSEGLPNSVIEALACGLPILLSSIEPHLQILSLSDSIGLPYDLGSDSSFILNFKKLQSSEHPYTKEACRTISCAQLSASKMSLNYQNIYNKLTS